MMFIESWVPMKVFNRMQGIFMLVNFLVKVAPVQKFPRLYFEITERPRQLFVAFSLLVGFRFGPWKVSLFLSATHVHYYR